MRESSDDDADEGMVADMSSMHRALSCHIVPADLQVTSTLL